MHSHNSRCNINYGGGCNCGFDLGEPHALAPVSGSAGDLERQRDELAGAFVKAQFEIHEEKAISGALRAAIINISMAADVLTGTKGVGVRNHIRKLAHDALEASKPKKQNTEADRP